MRPTTPKTRAEFVVGTADIVGRSLTPVPQRHDVEPIADDYVEDRLTEASEIVGTTPPDVYVWEMDVANAFVLGTPNNTKIVVSTALVELLTDDELVAVLTHELGHTAQQHTLKLTGLLLGAILFGAVSAVAAKRRWCFKASVAVIATLYFVQALGLLAVTRRAEAQADDLATDVVEPNTLDSALQKVIRAGRDEYPERTIVDDIIATHPAYRTRVETEEN